MNNTQIKEVAIYRDGALVKREGKVSLETGSRNVTLCDLPFFLGRFRAPGFT